jgi:hypothetical protein
MITKGDTWNKRGVDSPIPTDSTKTWVKLTALLFGVTAYQLNASMVAPAVPEIARRLGSTPAQVAISQTLFFLMGGIPSGSVAYSLPGYGPA